MKQVPVASYDDLSRFRTAFYLFLSRSFSREPDREMLDGVEQVGGGLLEAWESMGMADGPDIRTARRLLKTFFSDLREKGPGESIEQLAREYASLFLGVGTRTVSLCESVYRSKAGLLYQEVIFEVQHSYREIGLVKSDQYNEPDDHIAVELGYMARLCEMAQEAAGTKKAESLHYLRLQQTFLQAHLLQWVPTFSDDLVRAAPPGFYRAVAYLLKGYSEIDGTLINSMIEELNHKPVTRKARNKAAKATS